MFRDKIKMSENNFYGEQEKESLVMKDIESIKNYLIDVREFKNLSWMEKSNILCDFILFKSFPFLALHKNYFHSFLSYHETLNRILLIQTRYLINHHIDYTKYKRYPSCIYFSYQFECIDIIAVSFLFCFDLGML